MKTAKECPCGVYTSLLPCIRSFVPSVTLPPSTCHASLHRHTSRSPQNSPSRLSVSRQSSPPRFLLHLRDARRPRRRAWEPGSVDHAAIGSPGKPRAAGTELQNSEASVSTSPHPPCIPGDSSRVPPPGSPHSQRTVWKAQRGCFSKLSPNLRTRSRRSRYASPAGPFILVLCLALGPGPRLSQPSGAAAPASAPGRSSGPCGLCSPGESARPLERPESRLAVWRQMPRPSPAVPPRPSPPRPPSAPFPASRRTPLCERRLAEVRGARCGSGLEVDGGEAEMR